MAEDNLENKINDEKANRLKTLMDLEQRKIQIENQDKREDAQRSMAWFALFGMLLYPFAVLLANWAGLEQGAEILGDMAATYFVSVAAIVAAFYGSQAYVTRRSENNYSENNYTE